jgi:RND superfamily putative drug exporter
LSAVDRRLGEALPGGRIASYASTGDDAFVSDDGRTTYAIAYPPLDPNSAFGENPEPSGPPVMRTVGARNLAPNRQASLWRLWR